LYYQFYHYRFYQLGPDDNLLVTPGECAERLADAGWGGPQDLEGAVDLYRSAAAQNDMGV